MGQSTGKAPVSVFVDLTSYGSTEGIAIDAQGNIYATAMFAGEVLKITPAGSVSSYARIPGFAGAGGASPQENGLIGLAIDGEENIYALVAAFPSDAAVNDVVGVWKIGRGGKRVELLARGKAAGMVFPNFAIFDRHGNLFMTDSTLGIIYKISPNGTVVEFLRHPMLRAASDALVAVGANGLGFDQAGDLYVANTFPRSKDGPEPMRGLIAKVAMNPDGTAGAISVFTDQVTSPDGILFDAQGNIYVAQNFGNGISKVSRTGVVSMVAAGAPLAMPASLAIRGNTLYATNLAFPDTIGEPIGPPSISAIDISPR